MTEEEKRTYNREYKRKYRVKNHGRVLEIARAYRATHKEQFRKYAFDYARKNREKIIARKAKWREKNREQFNAAAREYYKKHKKQCKENSRISYHKRPIKRGEMTITFKKQDNNYYYIVNFAGYDTISKPFKTIYSCRKGALNV